LKIITDDKETISSALKRMNSEKGLSAAEERKRRWAAKKAGVAQQEDSRSKIVTELTSLADSLVSLGHMDAYQLNPPRIRTLLEGLKRPSHNAATSSRTQEFDMFAEEEPSSSAREEPLRVEDEPTMWEYQLKGADGKVLPPIHGPCTTAQIADRSSSSEKFKHGAVVRRVGTQAFHDIKRVDFDLYE